MKSVIQPSDARVQLLNPVQAHFPTFIVAQAAMWQARCVTELSEQLADPDLRAELLTLYEAHRPGMAFAESSQFHDFVAPFAKKYVAQENSAKGQHLVLCGAGPTLADHAEEWCPQADQVWGCNSAATWLLDHGHKATHAFTVDQTAHMLDEWRDAPDLHYLVASTVHPHLTEYLRAHGRDVTWFHNFVGIKERPVRWADANGIFQMLEFEDWLYTLLFPPTIRAGSGLNSVTRALDVAQFMGFDKITVLGADCCLKIKGKFRNDFAFNSKQHRRWLKQHTQMHADGGHALVSDATPVTLSAVIDAGTEDKTVRPGHGTLWVTKPDLVLSAQWLTRMERKSGGVIELVGKTLPVALRNKNEDFLRAMPNFADKDGSIDALLPTG